MLLGGDIGGTKTTLILFSEQGPALHPLFRLSMGTRDFANTVELVRNFLARARQAGITEEPSWASFACAGALIEDRVVTNNLPWIVDRGALAKGLGLEWNRTFLFNDLVAAAASLEHLSRDDFLPLNQSTPQARAPKALISAGTGLGEAFLFWNGDRYQVFPSEASLTDFAPRNDRELLLVHSLRQRMPRVCCEEIVSGRGFRAIHQIVFPGVQHAWFDDPSVDPAARITQQALEGRCSACVETLQMWTEAYGAEAGNMALRVLPFGGVYVAGGIALRILPKMKDGTFVRIFRDKAKLSSELARIPISVVLNEDAPVLGAAYEALATNQC
ncbi:MAG TPA: glucokinase [Terriglobales bacterium]|nr:glucokinase [Terriglobales bacterium]